MNTYRVFVGGYAVTTRQSSPKAACRRFLLELDAAEDLPTASAWDGTILTVETLRSDDPHREEEPLTSTKFRVAARASFDLSGVT